MFHDDSSEIEDSCPGLFESVSTGGLEIELSFRSLYRDYIAIIKLPTI